MCSGFPLEVTITIIRHQSRDAIYPVLKGSGFVQPNLLTKPLPFKTGYITSRD